MENLELFKEDLRRQRLKLNQMEDTKTPKREIGQSNSSSSSSISSGIGGSSRGKNTSSISNL